MPYAAVLFDCDGVLIDSEPMGSRAIAAAMTEVGFPMTEIEAGEIFSGNSGAASRHWMDNAGVDGRVIAAKADELLFRMFDENVPLIHGIDDVLQGLDVPVAICSNSGVERLNRSVMRTAIAPYFGVHVYSSDHVTNPKPAPDMALHAALRLGVDPSDAIFVDDNIHGMRCAVSAGCTAIGFIGPSEHRYNHEATLRQAGAHHVANGMQELSVLLKDLS